MRNKALGSRSGSASIALYIVLLAAIFVALVIGAVAEPKLAAADSTEDFPIPHTMIATTCMWNWGN
ncbi:hypothetical protein BST12_16695 [Mycobacterium angelicum]|uniref:Uncharacterized protein n=1 Tax=Mycobacterium angelicum TaxID=470074 RepID=A0A1W9ZPQ2_MYCAN|nr:hypothetical protein [Mycobacterium angelicum]MCV7199121.1 hypothetical protein [Mycobacterium angelicum]ORA19588.1 hypothetical protein BST12_16695 [Mycobacterium angelicum]